MKVALVYDYLNQYGGGERVLEIFCQMFPDAPVYTLFYDEQRTLGKFKGKIAGTSFLDFPLVWKKHRPFIPLMPLAAQYLDVGRPEMIISVGASYARGVPVPAGTKSLHYCFTPLRYAWHEEFVPPRLKPLGFLTRPLRSYLRRWDRKAGRRPDKTITISNFIAEKVKQYYGRTTSVIHPPLNTDKFFWDPNLKKEDYFLAAGRLLHYKKFDLIIEAFNQLKVPLKIAGDGPERAKLKKLIRFPGIEMLGFVSDDNLRELYGRARAFIFPQVEDFGLVGAEAQACGTPVIALAAGGALDIVENGRTGVFFYKQTIADLVGAIRAFGNIGFNPQLISQSARRFSADNFKTKLAIEINKLYNRPISYGHGNYSN